MTGAILLALLSLAFVFAALLVFCLCVIAARSDREMEEKFREHLQRQTGGWRN